MSPSGQGESAALPVTVIEPSRAWFRIPLRELWHYRDLVALMVRRNYVASYKQTVLGPLWFIIQPLFQTIVFTVIFGKIASLPTDNLPMMLFYMCGQLGWAYFVRCMGGNSAVFTSNVGLFGKVYFPRLVVPLATSINALFGIGIQVGMFAAFWTYFKFFTPAGATFGLVLPAFVLLPLCFLQSGLLGLGVGLWLSSLSAKYRDVSRMGGMLTSLWMYATPIVWPLSLFLERVPERWHWLPLLNPMTFPVECFRVALLGQGTLLVGTALSSLLLAAVAFASGVMIFNRTERTFIDTA